MNILQVILAKVYAGWEWLSPGIRAGVSLFVVSLIGVGLAFGWQWPSNWTDAKAEIAAFWVVIIPAAYGLFQKYIWPPVLAAILKMLGLSVTVAATGRRVLLPAK